MEQTPSVRRRRSDDAAMRKIGSVSDEVRRFMDVTRAHRLGAERRVRLRALRLLGRGPVDPATNQWLLDELGVDADAVRARLHTTLAASGLASVPGDSYHYTAFAALHESGFRPSVVLELGTFLAEASVYLATLFPEATVYTVDVPAHDPLVQRGVIGHLGNAERAARLASRTNLVALDANTLALPSLDLPEPDLVWLDAGHQFPEVAWDHFYCLHRLRPGGWLFTDDVRTPENPMNSRRASSLDVHTVTSYWNDRSDSPFRLLLKRPDPELALIDPKFIGCVHRAAGASWSPT
jgi:predicted O-methyltransferase YrrM